MITNTIAACDFKEQIKLNKLPSLSLETTIHRKIGFYNMLRNKIKIVGLSTRVYLGEQYLSGWKPALIC
jgi:hypothetical protein